MKTMGTNQVDSPNDIRAPPWKLFHFQKQESQGKHDTGCSGTSPDQKLTFLGVPEGNGGKNKHV